MVWGQDLDVGSTFRIDFSFCEWPPPKCFIVLLLIHVTWDNAT